MPIIRTYNQRSFAPFPIEYSSESFAPLVREDRQISHVRYHLRGQYAALACFRHYLTDCLTIFALEQTLQELWNNRDYVFADFVTPDVVQRLQPFLIQTHRRLLAPASIVTTTDASSVHSQPSPWQPQRHVPLPWFHQLVLASTDTSLPSSSDSTPALDVAQPTAISPDALNEVRVFITSRGVVLRFSLSFSLQMIYVLQFLSLWYISFCSIYLCFLLLWTFYFWTVYKSHRNFM